MKSLTVYFCQYHDRLRERFEHELTWLSFKNITRGPTLSEKDRHCMRDERIRRDTSCHRLATSRPHEFQGTIC